MLKNTVNQRNDGTTVAMIVTDAQYSASAHKYNVTSTMANGSTTFNSNCSKCHNAKNGETTTFQSSTNKFGTHDSTAKRLVAALGGTLVEGYEEAFCYRCHSKAGDAIGGTKKSADANDWYGAVTNMSSPSTSIYPVFQKTYKHNVAGYSGIHKPSPTDETRTYLSANKHVECDDCHNPHAAKAGLHSSNQVHVAAGTNLISDSGPLTGAVGAEPTWSGSNWGGASSWPATSSTATKEYQICFKCHADYNTNPSGWNSANIDWINTTGPSAWTNVALEFNPNNQSYHPVVQALPVTDPGDNGSSRLHPAFISLMIGDSGSATIPSTYDSLTDTAKSWTANQWQNWGVRIGYKNYSNRDVYNNIRRITSNTTDTLTVDAAFQGTYAIFTSNNSYSIEYYAGRGTKAGTTVTDMNKNFNLYLSSLVGYVVVVLDDVGMYAGKGTVVSNTATSFTVGGWTPANTLWAPGDGPVNYYFSASGRTMMCSDCHSDDVISSTAAQGPHGSAIKWMLKGRNKAWPETSASGFGDLRILGSTNNFYDNDGKTDGLFCLNCHPTISFVKDSYGLQSNNSYYNIHLRHGGRPCVRCHIVIPHGGKMSRLIGDNDSTMPARYAYDNNLSGMWVTSFLKADGAASYSPGDNHCTTICHHGASGGGNPAWENW